MRTLRIAAGAEAASFAVLLGNLLTTHTQAITTLVGPLHGTAYLVAIAAASMAPSAASTGARWRAAIPGVGGLLALRQIRNPSREANLSPATPRKADVMDDAHGELPFPRTDIALSAMRFVQEDPAILNHSMRTLGGRLALAEATSTAELPRPAKPKD